MSQWPLASAFAKASSPEIGSVVEAALLTPLPDDEHSVELDRGGLRLVPAHLRAVPLRLASRLAGLAVDGERHVEQPVRFPRASGEDVR